MVTDLGPGFVTEMTGVMSVMSLPQEQIVGLDRKRVGVMPLISLQMKGKRAGVMTWISLQVKDWGRGLGW